MSKSFDTSTFTSYLLPSHLTLSDAFDPGQQLANKHFEHQPLAGDLLSKVAEHYETYHGFMIYEQGGCSVAISVELEALLQQPFPGKNSSIVLQTLLYNYFVNGWSILDRTADNNEGVTRQLRNTLSSHSNPLHRGVNKLRNRNTDLIYLVKNQLYASNAPIPQLNPVILTAVRYLICTDQLSVCDVNTIFKTICESYIQKGFARNGHAHQILEAIAYYQMFMEVLSQKRIEGENYDHENSSNVEEINEVMDAMKRRLTSNLGYW